MFNSNKDFYPTPYSVMDIMQIDCIGKVVLEPSAGKGNIVDFLKANGAKDVLVCESNKDLAEIIKGKGRFLGYDFLKLKPEEISHIDMIIMNPPFSSGAKHLLYAWNVAPDGCEIISLLNYQSIENDYTAERRELIKIIEMYGTTMNLGDAFSDAERKTDVEIALVKLYKPKAESREWEGFFMDEEVEDQGDGIMRFNSVRDIVNRYVASVKKFEQILVLSQEMSALNIPFGISGITCEIGYNNTVSDKESYKKELQRRGWKYLFHEMNLDKYVTTGVMKDINAFVENQTKVPFTMKNVYKMFEVIVGTREVTFNRSLVEAIDKFTEHTHENRFNVEGWKTNAGHLLGEKFIVGWILERGYHGNLRPRYSQYENKLDDLNKVLCSLTGTNYDRIPKLDTFCNDVEMKPNIWYDWGFFEIKGFKKGTLHCKFKEQNTWAIVNRKYAEIKGQVLPEKMRSK